MSLQIYNTLTAKKEPFESLEPGHVRMYVCGPTVYDMSHIGHARAYVAFDVVYRYLLRHWRVTYARNYTDIDDKIIKRANETGQPFVAVAERYAREFLTDMDALGCARPTVEPKVSEHLQPILAMIAKLIDRGLAYAAGGDVYYAVAKFDGYGKLSKRSLDDLEAGARVEPGELKQNPLDFALWKGAKPGEPAWDSPWGKGRRGWHIECSAMSATHLGETFDIHGGGKDLVFPHHENEIAQSEGANQHPYARVWMHNGFVNIDNEKMSKSLGNFFTIRDVLKTFDPQSLRYFLLSVHYRSPINFSDVGLAEAEERVRYLYETLVRLDQRVTALGDVELGGPLREPWVAEIVPRFEATMDDDFNTGKALGELSEAFRLINETLDKPGDAATDARTLVTLARALREVGTVLGLFVESPTLVLERMAKRRQAARGVDAAQVEGLIAARNAARAAKDFARADALRKELADLGVVIKDSPQGTTWQLA